ncbi:HalOD1 output domain-containing protein [Natronorubrum daqingense]|uniref:Halobacterial output domain-containing protein n=1 Tax=Natronorubrum daqingense TaxID=588898 RepID=A0A1N7ENU9_9EURY|nr:HalOD1 output domain-containing protein [Natronorubrum daqingense]APX97832.1 hypothetical protein BB347_15070 [Natronorubrum daqingense]SIR89768.1 hypothetical protein SAMN05421809_2739 [Natronorubrum daqingense]
MPSPDDSHGPDNERYVSTFDPDAGERASVAVVTAVEAVSQTDSLELPPLHDVVDPDALDSLVEHARRSGEAGQHELWFTYAGFEVGVRSDGRVLIGESTVANPNPE